MDEWIDGRMDSHGVHM